MDCGMPKLHIMGDSTHSGYSILASGVTVFSVEARWRDISSDIMCKDNTCNVTMNNLCPLDNQPHIINWVALDTSIGTV